MLTPTVLAGRYRIQAASHCGALVRARDERSGADVFVSAAFKRAEDQSAREHGARAFSDLRHPHLLPLRDHGFTDDGVWFAVTDARQGQTLLALLRRRARLPPIEAVRIALEAARALVALNHRGLTNAGLAPCTVFLERTREGTVTRLMYSGALLSPSADAKASSGGTNETSEAGEEEWCAHRDACRSPELLAERPADARSDVYSLAVLLYRMLTGSLPGPADGYRRCEDAQAGAGVQSRRRHLSDARIPKPIQDAVGWALATDPADRPDPTTFEVALVYCYAELSCKAARTSMVRRQCFLLVLTCALSVAIGCAAQMFWPPRAHRVARDNPGQHEAQRVAPVQRDAEPRLQVLGSDTTPIATASTRTAQPDSSKEAHFIAGLPGGRHRVRQP